MYRLSSLASFQVLIVSTVHVPVSIPTRNHFSSPPPSNILLYDDPSDDANLCGPPRVVVFRQLKSWPTCQDGTYVPKLPTSQRPARSTRCRIRGSFPACVSQLSTSSGNASLSMHRPRNAGTDLVKLLHGLLEDNVMRSYSASQVWWRLYITAQSTCSAVPVILLGGRGEPPLHLAFLAAASSPVASAPAPTQMLQPTTLPCAWPINACACSSWLRSVLLRRLFCFLAPASSNGPSLLLLLLLLLPFRRDTTDSILVHACDAHCLGRDGRAILIASNADGMSCISSRPY
jgi:hypothetical protein